MNTWKLRERMGLLRITDLVYAVDNNHHLSRLRAKVNGREVAVESDHPDLDFRYEMFWTDTGEGVSYELSRIIQDRVRAARFAALEEEPRS